MRPAVKRAVAIGTVFWALSWATAPLARAAAVPPVVKDVVTFVFLKGDKDTYLPLGTAFFVGIEEEKPHRGFGYLVTAKHVLHDERQQRHPSVYIRLHRKAGDAEIIEIPLVGKEAPPVYVHPDPLVDVAAIPMLPNMARYDFKYIPQDMLPAPESFKALRLHEGDEAFFVGLFWQFVGEKRNYPVVRFGRVALVTEEKIPWRSAHGTERLDLFLVDTPSFGGNSGAPVFVRRRIGKEPGKPGDGEELVLGGIMKGTFVDPKETVSVGREPAPLALQNMGLAAVVPASKLHDVLYAPEVRAARAKGP